MTADELTNAFEAFRPRAASLAHQILRNPADVEDCLQNAAILVWRNAAHFEGRSQPSTWFSAIVRNMAFDILRRSRRHRNVMNVEIAESLPSKDHIEAALIAEERRRVVYRSIGTLNPLMREGLIEHYLTKTQVRSNSTTKVRAYRAVRVLRTMRAIQAAA